MSGGDVACAGFSQALIDNGVDACGDLRIDKRRKLRVLIVCGARNNRRQPLRERFGALVGRRGGPNWRGVDARAAAVIGNRRDHYIEILFPIVDTVFTDDDLAVTWTMNLNTRIVGPRARGRRIAKEQGTTATPQDF